MLSFSHTRTPVTSPATVHFTCDAHRYTQTHTHTHSLSLSPSLSLSLSLSLTHTCEFVCNCGFHGIHRHTSTQTHTLYHSHANMYTCLVCNFTVATVKFTCHAHVERDKHTHTRSVSHALSLTHMQTDEFACNCAFHVRCAQIHIDTHTRTHAHAHSLSVTPTPVNSPASVDFTAYLDTLARRHTHSLTLSHTHTPVDSPAIMSFTGNTHRHT